MATTVDVVITSVPERAENLECLLDDLSDQTTRIEHVHLLLNGWSDADAEQINMHHERRGRNFDLHIDASSIRRPAGYRWRIIESLTSTFVAVLDDDLRILPEYLKRTLTTFTEPDIGLVSWTGNAYEKKRPYYGFVARAVTTPLWIAGAGTSMIQTALLRGITTHPLAEELLVSGGDDEALVSFSLWERGYRLLRPSGVLPVHSVHTLQESSTSSHKLHGPRWEFRRSQMRKQYGWGNDV